MILAALNFNDLLNPLVLFGFLGQFVFMLRFLVQWYESERRRRSVMPVSFWYISLVGGSILFVYALLREDIVFMAGQALGMLIYVRNIMLIQLRLARIRTRSSSSVA